MLYNRASLLVIHFEYSSRYMTLKGEFWKKRMAGKTIVIWGNSVSEGKKVLRTSKGAVQWPLAEGCGRREWIRGTVNETVLEDVTPGFSGGKRVTCSNRAAETLEEERDRFKEREVSLLWDALIWSCLPDTELKVLISPWEFGAPWGCGVSEAIGEAWDGSDGAGREEGWESDLRICEFKERHLKRSFLGILL